MPPRESRAARDARAVRDAVRSGRRTARTTESPLELPSLGRAARVAARALRLRCPHCGGSRVLGAWGRVRYHCTSCGLRYERSDDHYFSGALFCNLMLSEGLFAVVFLGAVAVSWPNVPWEALTYGGMAVMLVLPVLLYPFSKVVWLAVDVCVRPVTPAECIQALP